MNTSEKRLNNILLTFAVFALWNWQTSESTALTFVVTSDNHSGYNNSQKALWRTIAPHRGVFAMTAGDVGSPDGIRKTIDECFGAKYPWYVAAGNHDLRKDRMAALRTLNPDGNSLPNIVNPGPANCKETTYSFRYENCHFVILNQYYDGDSDIGYKTADSKCPFGKPEKKQNVSGSVTGLGVGDISLLEHLAVIPGHPAAGM